MRTPSAYCLCNPDRPKTSRKIAVFLTSALMLGTAALLSRAYASVSFQFFGPDEEIRDKLTAAELLEETAALPIHNYYFLPISQTTTPPHPLSGTIHFSEASMKTTHPSSDWKGGGQNIFPGFSISFVSHREHLIPLQRGIIVSGEKRNSFWNIIVSPGRIWRENGDNGLSRAAFPFTLTDNAIGQARNGIATFVYDHRSISCAAIQVTQETAPIDAYFHGNFSALIPARYIPGNHPESLEVIDSFDREIKARIPVKPWAELSNPVWLKHIFNGGLSDDKVSAAALYMDGAIYLQGIQTRTGPYPFPLEMRHGVFSVTKSLAMGLAMFYAAERYGDEIFNERICDYVPKLADHPGWHGVTFEHALGMATGTSGSEEGMDIVPYILARTADEKIEAIRDLPDADPAPGARMNYASTNFFALSYALNRFVKSMEGPQGDYWNLVKRDVLTPMGIGHMALTRTVESNGQLGIPIMGWGSYPTFQEAVKIARLLYDEGEFQGRQLLSRKRVREALSRTEHRGWNTELSSIHPQYYMHSLWQQIMLTDRGKITVPSMRGHGGNLVGILPSGAIVLRFGDENYTDLRYMIEVAEYLRPSQP